MNSTNAKRYQQSIKSKKEHELNLFSRFSPGDVDVRHDHRPRHDLPHVGGRLRGRLPHLQLGLLLLQPLPHRHLHRGLPHLQVQVAAAALGHPLHLLRVGHDGRHSGNGAAAGRGRNRSVTVIYVH